jgi:ribosomal protein L16 Arg81 hydroxylase
MPLSDLVEDVPDLLAAWPAKPRVHHHDPSAFRDLLTLNEANDLIDSECIPAHNVVLVAPDGTLVDRRSFVAGDMPHPGTLRAHLDNGGTVSLRKLENMRPPLSRLRADIQAETGCRTHINAYMTPPGCQGFRYHYDPYVTLIVQLAGRKTWPVHEPFVENPVREWGNFITRGFTNEEHHFLANTPPAASYTLAPGDVLWLPRAYVHSPYTEGDETSLHLTFALAARTFHWLAQQMVDEALAHALADPALREEITPSSLLADPAPAMDRMREYLVGALHLVTTDDEMLPIVRNAVLATD